MTVRDILRFLNKRPLHEDVHGPLSDKPRVYDGTGMRGFPVGQGVGGTYVPPLLPDRPSKLSVFDDLSDHVLTHRAFVGALIEVRLVGFDPSKPHRYATLSAFWVFDFGSIDKVGHLHEASRLAVAGGSATGLSATGACGNAAAGDKQSVRPSSARSEHQMKYCRELMCPKVQTKDQAMVSPGPNNRACSGGARTLRGRRYNKLFAPQYVP
jgi:hypothetical protein